MGAHLIDGEFQSDKYPIPSNKDAMPVRELHAYLGAVRPAAVHLLGMGPQAARFPGFVEMARRARADVAISCDSNLIAAHVGHTNGRGGGPRLVTAWAEHLEREVAAGRRAGRQDRIREDAVAMAFGPQIALNRFYRGFQALGYVFTPDGGPPRGQRGLFGDGKAA